MSHDEGKWQEWKFIVSFLGAGSRVHWQNQLGVHDALVLFPALAKAEVLVGVTCRYVHADHTLPYTLWVHTGTIQTISN